MAPDAPSADRSSITRRRLLGALGFGGALGVGAVWLLGVPGQTASAKGQTLVAPPRLPIRRLPDGTLEATLVSAPAPVTLAGLRVNALTYNGSVPGPTLTLHEGDRVRLNFVNRLGVHSSLHTHGLHLSPEQDNPFIHVMPGDTRPEEFTIPSGSAGLYWYHPHPHGEVAEQLFAGLAGATVVRGPVDDLPELRAAEEHLLILKDYEVLAGAVGGHAMINWLGKQGRILTVNGQHAPQLRATRPTLRLRLLNASNARPFLLRLDGHPLHLIGTDGGFLERPVTLDSLLLAPGERADVLVRLEREGTFTLWREPYSQGGFLEGLRGLPGPPEALMTITAPPNPKPGPLPGFLQAVERLDASRVTQRRHIAYDMGFGLRFSLNGQAFDPNRTDITAKLGDLELWEIENGTNLDHPFHLHTYPVQVAERFTGGRWRPAPERAWKDTVNVRGHERVRLLVPLRDFAGRTVYHCHVLEHEDRGMMGVLEVRG